LLISDVDKYQGDISINPGVKSEMAVPIQIGERTAGVLNVESRQSTSYSEDDLHLLITIAGQLSIAMEKIHLLENEHRRLQESETLRQAASVISTSLDLELVLDTILSSVKKVVPLQCRNFLSEIDRLSCVVEPGIQDNKNPTENISRDWSFVQGNL
jgi:GAF domain-containing protein